jgi:hypothetical protein
MQTRNLLIRTRFSVAVAIVLLSTLLALAANAAPRMYTGSLIIAAFGNDTYTGATSPYNTSYYVGIPLVGNCNTAPFHAHETLTFPTQSLTTPTQTVMFTIPDYGGAVATIDTNYDTIPDLVPGCTSNSLGDPLTGSGYVATTGDPATSRTSLNPRKIILPQGNLSKVTDGASFNQYGVYLWEVHFADLQNDVGNFSKDGGDGDFAVIKTGTQGTRMAVQTAGTNKFGGVMQLLGIYGDREGYFLADGSITSVFYFDWLFHYLGAGGQATSGGVVTEGWQTTTVNYGYTRTSGYPTTSRNEVTIFKWTTGTVKVTAIQGTFPTVLERKGYDSRTAMGSGVVQLVSPMLSHWVGAGVSGTGAIGIMNLTLAPEPSSAAMLGTGAAFLGLLVRARFRSKR